MNPICTCSMSAIWQTGFQAAEPSRRQWRKVDTFTRPAMKKVQTKMVRLGYNVGDTH